MDEATKLLVEARKYVENSALEKALYGEQPEHQIDLLARIDAHLKTGGWIRLKDCSPEPERLVWVPPRTTHIGVDVQVYGTIACYVHSLPSLPKETK